MPIYKSMTKHILLLAALGLALSAIGAQAQEYQNQSTVRAPGFEQTTYEDGSTTTTRWHVNNATGEITNIETVRTHATPVVSATPVPVRTQPIEPTLNHDGRAFDNLPKAAASLQAPVTVIEGPMTPEQIRRLVNGQ
jgi:hypothetical protein